MFSPALGHYTYITRETNYYRNSAIIENGRLVEKEPEKGNHRYYNKMVSGWNFVGYTPILRLVSGSIRACLGIVDVIIGLVAPIFTQKKEYQNIINIGLQNVFRGAFEVLGDVLILQSLVSHNELSELNFGLLLLVPSITLIMYDIFNNDADQHLVYEP